MLFLQIAGAKVQKNEKREMRNEIYFVILPEI